MIKIYCINRKENECFFIREVLQKKWGVDCSSLERNENGKPYFKNDSLFFNVTNTTDFSALAISEKEIGVDAENLKKNLNIERFKRILSEREKEEITNVECFLKNWTAKESYVKKHGFSLSFYLKRLEFFNETLYLDGIPVDERPLFFKKGDILICLSSEERDFETIDL